MLRKTMVLVFAAVLVFASFAPSILATEKNNSTSLDLTHEKIIEHETKEFQEEIEESDIGYESIDPLYSGGIQPSWVDDGGGSGGTGWFQIAKTHKVLTRGDFFIDGAYVAIKTSLLGYAHWSLSLAAVAFGVMETAVPDALPGEKLHMRKDMRWIDKDEYIYDVRTIEYIYRNGKTYVITEKVVRGNGWAP